jgi:LuxR family transcriptional regulator (chaperone HchA-associated)
MSSADAFAVVQVIDDSDTLEAIIAALRGFSTQFGYDRLALFSVTKVQDEPVDRLYWVEGNWFAEGEAVDADTYIRRCPVTRNIFELDAPFFWSKTVHGENERYKVVAHPQGPGVHGLQIPVFGPSGLEGAVSLGGESIDASRGAKLALSLVAESALRAARRALDFSPNTHPDRLSAREREVLRWLAAGKRQVDIAATLGLSERTIENHLRRIRLRLGAKTSAEAIRIGLRNGDIAE